MYDNYELCVIHKLLEGNLTISRVECVELSNLAYCLLAYSVAITCISVLVVGVHGNNHLHL